MKAAFFLIVTVMFLSVRAHAQMLTSGGSLSLKLLISGQDLDIATTSKTNGTTVTTVSKSTVTNDILQSADFLALLENSFSTNFPVGAQLRASRLGLHVELFVTDSSGTNVIQNLSTNCYLGFFADGVSLDSGILTRVTKSGSSGTSTNSNHSDTFTEMVVLSYNDSGLTTGDGTHTHFQANCLLTRKSSENVVTRETKDSVKFQGAGYGVIRDKRVIVQASGTAEISGVLFIPF